MPSLFQSFRSAFNRTSGSVYSDDGVPGFQSFGGYLATNEQNANLTGRARYTKASEMLANVSIIAASVRYFLDLLSKPDWSFEPAGGENATDEAKAAADFMQDVLDNCGTNITRIVRRTGMYRFHGFSFQEWIALKREDGRIGIKDIKPRPQHTINRWDLDERGEVLGVEQTATYTGQTFYLPRRKLIYLVDDTLTDSPEGMGWFRNLVEHADRLQAYLDHEAMGFLRDLSGVPIGRAPIAELKGKVGGAKPGGGVYTSDDINRGFDGIREFIRSKVRQPDTSILMDSAVYKDSTDTGQKSGSALKWGVELLTGKAESLPDIAKAIERIAYEMARIMGTEVILTGSDGTGSLALSTNQSQNLYLKVNATLVDIGEAFNRDLIDPIWALNGLPDELKPKCKPGEVLFRDVEAAAAVIRDLATAGAILGPDDPAIDEMRMLVGLSPQPEMTPERMEMLAALNAPPADPESGGSGNEKPPKGESKAKKSYNPDQPRDPGGDGGGQWVSSMPPEANAESPPVPGKEFLVYRAGGESEAELKNQNAGDAMGVAVHLSRMDDYGAPAPKGGAPTHLHAYGVTIDEPVGGYQHINAGRSNSTDNSNVGMERLTHGTNFSFGETGFSQRRIASVPLEAVRAKITEKYPDITHGHFDEVGYNGVRDAIRASITSDVAKRYNPDQPRDPAGTATGGQWTDGDAGEVKQVDQNTVAELESGLEQDSIDELFAKAEVNQDALRDIGKSVSEDLGVQFVDPGLKERASFERKLITENYDAPYQIKDISRATFAIDRPEDSDAVIAAMARDNVVYDKGWNKIASTGYVDRKTYVKFPNGGVAEIQIVPKPLEKIKHTIGEKLYNITRDPKTTPKVRLEVEQQQRDLYGGAMENTPFAGFL